MKNTNTSDNNNVIKIVRDRQGRFVKARPGMVKKEALKLTCCITGKSRPTNMKYLEAKAQRLNVSVSDLTENYVSKEGFNNIASDHPKYDLYMRMNGKVKTKKNELDKELVSTV